MFILNFLWNRFREPSTWAGAMLVAQAFGLQLTPEQMQAIGVFGMALMAAPDSSIDKLKARYAQIKRN